MPMENYYEENHQSYFRSTVSLDPASFLLPLAKRLRPGATILDIGCGSGRDLRWLAEQGFRPTGFEKSPSLARLAREYSGCRVLEGDFTTHDFSSHRFDALILVGSLVHVERDRLGVVLAGIFQALVPGGLALVTMKEGSATSSLPDGRRFTLWSRSSLEMIFTQLGLNVLACSRKESKLRETDVWLGFVFARHGGQTQPASCRRHPDQGEDNPNRKGVAGNGRV